MPWYGAVIGGNMNKAKEVEQEYENSHSDDLTCLAAPSWRIGIWRSGLHRNQNWPAAPAPCGSCSASPPRPRVLLGRWLLVSGGKALQVA